MVRNTIQTGLRLSAPLGRDKCVSLVRGLQTVWVVRAAQISPCPLSAREPSPLFAWLISIVLKVSAKAPLPTGSPPGYVLSCQVGSAGNARRTETVSFHAKAEPKLRKYLCAEKKITCL